MMSKTLNQAVSTNDKVGFKLLDHLGTENMVMSSFSLGTVMAMVLAGAQNKTKDQILAFFEGKETKDVSKGFKECLNIVKEYLESSTITLKAANRIYTEQSFNILTEYAEHLKTYYFVEPLAVDFIGDPEGSRESINTWVEQQTNNKIKDLLASGTIDPGTRVVLVNALYFKGNWAEPFDAERTYEEDFFVDSKTTVRAQMMHQETKFGFKEFGKELEGATALSMPYEGDQLEMVLILPREGSTLNSLEKAMSVLDLSKHMNDFSYGEDVITTIPKFKVESTHKLNEPLKIVGITEVFDSCNADLSGVCGDKSLFLSLVIQKAFIEVNEEGAEAAATTAAVITLGCAPVGPPLEFNCNRPFHFMIRIRSSGLILFSGRVNDPTI